MMFRTLIVTVSALGLACVGEAHAATYTCVSGVDNHDAINALLRGGGLVSLSAGKCEITSGLVMDVPGTTLVGAGDKQGGTDIYIPVQSPQLIFDMLTIGDAGGSYHGAGFTVQSLSLNGNITTAQNGTTGQGRGIRIVGGVYADATHSFGVSLSNVEAWQLVGGISIAGSDITSASLNLHDNRHSGFFAEGDAGIPSPNNVAHDITLKSSQVVNNQLDSTTGNTYDSVDIGPRTSGVTIGGPGSTDGNAVTAGDILFGCPPETTMCASPNSNLLAQNNTVVNTTSQVRDGLRLYGNITSATVDHNNITAIDNGIAVLGNVTDSVVSNNTVSNTNTVTEPYFVGIQVNEICVTVGTVCTNYVGDHITLDSNGITMTDNSNYGISVASDTNVTVKNNNGNGAPCDYSNAGQGLALSGNSPTSCNSR